MTTKKKQKPALFEFPDKTPVAIPAKMKRPETLHEQIARLVRTERYAQISREAGFETFDEANDFDVEDDIFPMPNSPYELAADAHDALADYKHARISAADEKKLKKEIVNAKLKGRANPKDSLTPQPEGASPKKPDPADQK